MARPDSTLYRALACWCESHTGDIDRFLERVIFEVRHALKGDFVGIALVIKRRNGSIWVARDNECASPSDGALISLFHEARATTSGCVIRDHALDTVRFIDARFRTSILTRVELPEALAGERLGILWFGLKGGASAELQGHAQELATQLSEWFVSCNGIVSSVTDIVRRRELSDRRVRELTGLLHDARAPLGVMKFLARDPHERDALGALREEIAYLEKILSRGSPSAGSEVVEQCDLRDVILRVYRRYAREFGADSFGVESGYEETCARISDLDAERIVTNLVLNARRHSPGARISLSVEARNGEVVMCVRDNGRGISQEVLDRVRMGSPSASGPGAGWGIGLVQCIATVKGLGGRVEISSGDEVGTVIEVILPQVPSCDGRGTSMVADGGVWRADEQGAPEVVVIDDDREHGETLCRVLGRCGVAAFWCTAIEDFFERCGCSNDSIVVCDARMPDGGAERLLALLSEKRWDTCVAVMSGDVTDEYLYRISALGAQAFFAKPVEIEQLLTWVREVRVGLRARRTA